MTLRETGDRYREGLTLHDLSMALREVGRFEEAITAHPGAAVTLRETGDLHREGEALENLGNELREAGRFEEAATAHKIAAAIFRVTGDRRKERRAQFHEALALRSNKWGSRRKGNRHDLPGDQRPT